MRKIGLDIIRTIAVVLVLLWHSDLDTNVIKQFGWLGVDLFFVLSGFLISNLLFLEYRKKKEIRIRRFLTRRAFKIFPPFYFFVFATLSFDLFVRGNSNIELLKLLSELFYMQSYAPRIWLHTWTLAVEEHFYLAFSITLFLVIKNQGLEKRHIIISSLVFLLILSFAMRFHHSYPHRNEDLFGFMQTHLRSDGILFGILLSYLLNFTQILTFFQKRKWILICSSVLLMAPGFYFTAGSFFMNTAGLTMVNFGFSLLLLLLLDIDEYVENRLIAFFRIPLKFIGFIGLNSYSIYLWHLNSKSLSSWIFSFGPTLDTLIYIILSIIIGILMSYLIEKPSLKIRDYIGKTDLYSF